MSSRFSERFFMKLSGNSNDGITPSNTLLDGTEAAITANFTTTPVFVKDLDAYGIQFSTGAGSTLVGTLSIQVSSDRDNLELTGQPDPGTMVNWSTISFWDQGAGAQATSKAVASGAQSLILAERVVAYRWVRLVFAFTSGSGSPVVSFQQKGVS